MVNRIIFCDKFFVTIKIDDLNELRFFLIIIIFFLVDLKDVTCFLTWDFFSFQSFFQRFSLFLIIKITFGIFKIFSLGFIEKVFSLGHFFNLTGPGTPEGAGHHSLSNKLIELVVIHAGGSLQAIDFHVRILDPLTIFHDILFVGERVQILFAQILVRNGRFAVFYHIGNLIILLHM